jgi:hypothetical protein
MTNVTLVPSTWEYAPADLSVDVAFSVHGVYSLPRIEEFLQFLERVARRWVAVAPGMQASHSELAAEAVVPPARE